MVVFPVAMPATMVVLSNPSWCQAHCQGIGSQPLRYHLVPQ